MKKKLIKVIVFLSLIIGIWYISDYGRGFELLEAYENSCLIHESPDDPRHSYVKMKPGKDIVFWYRKGTSPSRICSARGYSESLMLQFQKSGENYKLVSAYSGMYNYPRSPLTPLDNAKVTVKKENGRYSIKGTVTLTEYYADENAYYEIGTVDFNYEVTPDESMVKRFIKYLYEYMF